MLHLDFSRKWFSVTGLIYTLHFKEVVFAECRYSQVVKRGCCSNFPKYDCIAFGTIIPRFNVN